jgi:Zn-dependent metalloprotease
MKPKTKKARTTKTPTGRRPMGPLAKLDAKVDRHPVRGTPQKLTDFVSRPLQGDLETASGRLVRALAPELGIDGDDLVFDKVVSSPLGKHVFFQQQIDGDRVSGGWLKLDVDPKGRVYEITNNCLPLASKERSLAKKAGAGEVIGADKAIELAIENIGIDPSNLRAKPKAEPVMLPVDHHAEPAWKILLASGKPLADLRIYVSRLTGRILKKDDLLKMAKVSALVFDPSPVAALDDATLSERSKLPPSVYQTVELSGLKATGHLDGAFVTTASTKGRVKVKKAGLTAKRGTTAFKEAMVYFHIDRAQRYLQSLGFSDINDRAIDVDVSGTTEDNSFYSPNTKGLSFGTGGVDDAEDAEIILHEYGHAIQDAQNPGCGADGESKAMGEGFGDYFAASFFEDRKPGRFRDLIGAWDATAYSNDDPPCLRRLDGTKRYPRDMVHEEHADGEIWSACLWQIRDQIGRHRADRLIISHHYLVGRDATFREAAKALVRTDQQLYAGANAAKIAAVFVKRGILPSSKKKRGYDPNARTNRPSAQGAP